MILIAPVPNPVVEEATLSPLPPNPCNPPPCGPNSQCQVVSGQAQCSCLTNMIGSAPNCRPECTVSTDCPSNHACINQKCVDPCPGSCALNTNCRVVNHSPVCGCIEGYTGDAFSSCRPIAAVGKSMIQYGNIALLLMKLWRFWFFIASVVLPFDVDDVMKRGNVSLRNWLLEGYMLFP